MTLFNRATRTTSCRRLKSAWLAIAVLALLAANPYTWTSLKAQEEANVAPGRSAIYTVRPADILEISVWKDENLQREVLVRPDGGISFPLVGDIKAQGKSVEEIRLEVARRLKRYIPNPVVTVVVKEILGNRVYVIGKVNEPGEFVVGRYVDVMQALSMAGGTATFASVNDIKILRRVGNKQTAIPFRYSDIEKGRKLEQNIILQDGDVVVVP